MRDFAVSPAVLIPRPETEILVEEALGRLDAAAPATIVDVCTGSGCIAVTLAAERPEWIVVGTDVSLDALRIARENAARHAAAGRVRFIAAHYLDGLAAASADAILANPPYVALRNRERLPRDIVDFEPPLALFAGPDGLDAYRALLPRVPHVLKRGGWCAVECGQGQAEAVAEIAREAGLNVEGLRRDLQHITRAVIVTRP
jgi:release factor glutamine methyltransferase